LNAIKNCWSKTNLKPKIIWLKKNWSKNCWSKNKILVQNNSLVKIKCYVQINFGLKQSLVKNIFGYKNCWVKVLGGKKDLGSNKANEIVSSKKLSVQKILG